MPIEGLGQTSHIQHSPEVSMPISQSASQSIDQLGSAKSSSTKERSTLGCIWNWICKILCCLWCYNSKSKASESVEERGDSNGSSPNNTDCIKGKGDSRPSHPKESAFINLKLLDLPSYEISVGDVESSSEKGAGERISFKDKKHEYSISFCQNGQKYDVEFSTNISDDILQAVATELKKSPEKFSITNEVWPLFNVTCEEFCVQTDGKKTKGNRFLGFLNRSSESKADQYLESTGIRCEIKNPFKENTVVGSAEVYFLKNEPRSKDPIIELYPKGLPLVICNFQKTGVTGSLYKALRHRLHQDHESVFLVKCSFNELLQAIKDLDNDNVKTLLRFGRLEIKGAKD